MKSSKDENNKRHSEPALIEQENVHIAETISEIRTEYPGRHKDSDPEIADKIVFNGSFDRNCILQVPYKENIWNNKDYLTLTDWQQKVLSV